MVVRIDWVDRAASA